ncbi:MAG: hypothetical protein J5780_05310, partial [Treponema sp.]|nr:hypothetical protein [Treponema sp.]
MKKFSFLTVLMIFLLHPCFLFSESTIISPVEGTFMNVQSLVIELDDGDEAYYSLSYSDPAVSG